MSDQILERGVNLLKLFEKRCQLSALFLRIICLASYRALRRLAACASHAHLLNWRRARRRRATARWHSEFHQGAFRLLFTKGEVWGMFSCAAASMTLRKVLMSGGEGVEGFVNVILKGGPISFLKVPSRERVKICMS